MVGMNNKRQMAWCQCTMFETHYIPHRISLNAKLLLEVKEYVLYLLFRKWDRAFTQCLLPQAG